MTRTATVRYNVTEDLRMPEEEMPAYLEATLEGADPQLIAAALLFGVWFQCRSARQVIDPAGF